jgi:glycosyltransferase involved in cell wall biosynthesis
MSAARSVCVISRQRLIGNTNGSSVYLLGLCNALWRAGMEVHYVCPTPAVFGRWPFLIMRPEMKIFSSIRIRGSLHVGSIFVAIDPRIGLRAIINVVAKKLGLASFTKPAPYSIALPLTPKDIRYLGRHANADAIIADYAFLTDAIAHSQCPDAKSAVIMHDMLSSTDYGPSDANAKVDLTTELTMLRRADAVVAIQANEAALIQGHLPDRRVILAPLATETVSSPQPGDGQDVLFVASKTTANVDGLTWLLSDVWPIVKARNRGATLTVAGTVGTMVSSVPDGVRILGFVSNLDPLYSRASVVVSPLRGGSGLKIKLVEALAQGKAIVATTTTLQGVEEAISPAVIVTDCHREFATSIISLLADKELRKKYSEAALAIAREKFSSSACYAEFVSYMAQA